MYTGPLTGCGWSGESMIAVPTRELSGQLLASAERTRAGAAERPAGWARAQRQDHLGPLQRGACSGSNFSVVLTGGQSAAA